MAGDAATPVRGDAAPRRAADAARGRADGRGARLAGAVRLRYPFAAECGVFRTSYRQELMLYYTPFGKVAVPALIVGLYLLPFVLSSYHLSLLNLVGIFSIAAIGLNIATGFAGQISVGHGAFTGVGAFTAGFLIAKQGWPFWVAAPVAGLAAAAVGGLFGLPSARLKGLYLAIASIAAQVILQFVFVRAEFWTGGVHSMSVPRPSLFGYVLRSERDFYFLVLSVALIMGIAAQNLVRTRVGRAFVAIRDRDLAAEVMGIDLFRYKVLAFTTSAFFAGIAGALWAPYTLIINPEQFGIGLSVELLAMIIIGGLGSVIGSVFGAFFMVLLPIVVRELAASAATLAPAVADRVLMLKDLAFGAAIILFLALEPEGLARLWRNVKDYFRLWPFSY